MPDWLTAKYFDPAAERDSSQQPVKNRNKENEANEKYKVG